MLEFGVVVLLGMVALGVIIIPLLLTVFFAVETFADLWAKITLKNK